MLQPPLTRPHAHIMAHVLMAGSLSGRLMVGDATFIDPDHLISDELDVVSFHACGSMVAAVVLKHGFKRADIDTAFERLERAALGPCRMWSSDDKPNGADVRLVLLAPAKWSDDLWLECADRGVLYMQSDLDDAGARAGRWLNS